MSKHQKQSIKSSNKGSIRIIAGKYRGRKLPVIIAEGLRPTTDRVKETVFNWLMPYIQDSNCLDCFAGSGNLGFEALSRGCQHATFLELNKSAATGLKQNQTLLNVSNSDIINTNTLTYLSNKPAQQYDLVFIDPPFRQQLVEKTAVLLNDGWLNPDALIYVEMEVDNNQQEIPSNWRMLKEKVAGQVVYQLYQYIEK